MTTAGGVGATQAVAVGVEVGGTVAIAVGGLCVGVAVAGAEESQAATRKRNIIKKKCFFICNDIILDLSLKFDSDTMKKIHHSGIIHNLVGFLKTLIQ